MLARFRTHVLEWQPVRLHTFTRHILMLRDYSLMTLYIHNTHIKIPLHASHRLHFLEQLKRLNAINWTIHKFYQIRQSFVFSGFVTIVAKSSVLDMQWKSFYKILNNDMRSKPVVKTSLIQP